MTVYDLTQSSAGNIKLGAKGGSGFVFCGKANTMNIDRLNERIIDKNENAFIKAKSRYRSIKSKSVSFDDYVSENREKPCTIEGYGIFLDEHYKRIKTAYKTLLACAERVANYTDLAGREIVESYKSIDEKNTIIVLYAGTEVGDAWTTEEYLKGGAQEWPIAKNYFE